MATFSGMQVYKNGNRVYVIDNHRRLRAITDPQKFLSQHPNIESKTDTELSRLSGGTSTGNISTDDFFNTLVPQADTESKKAQWKNERNQYQSKYGYVDYPTFDKWLSGEKPTAPTQTQQTPKFRSRNNGEAMQSYLEAKQGWEKQNLGQSGITLPSKEALAQGTVPYKFYKGSDGTVVMLPGTNTPQGYTNSSRQDFINFINKDRSKWDSYYARNTTPGLKEAYGKIMSGGSNVSSGLSYGLDKASGQYGWGKHDNNLSNYETYFKQQKASGVNPQQISQNWAQQQQTKPNLSQIEAGVKGAQQKANQIGQSIQALQGNTVSTGGVNVNGTNTTNTTGITPSITPNTTGTTGTTPNTNDGYQKFLLDTINQQNKYLKDYIDTLKNQKSQSDQYQTYSDQLGLPAQQKLVAGIDKQALDVEGLLSKLEGDINSRSSGHLVTEAQRRRYLATEGKPLRTQLADLMRSESRAKAGYTESRQQLADMMKNWSTEQQRQLDLKKLPMEYGYKNLPYYKEALTYETPKQKAARQLQEKLNEKKALKDAGLNTSTTQSAALKVFNEMGGKNGTGMSFSDWYKNVYKTNPVVNGINKQSQLAGNTFDASIAQDKSHGKFVDLNVYKDVRKNWIKNTGKSVMDFDAMFADTYLSPGDRDKIL